MRRTRATSWAIYHTKADCDLACKRPGWRAWAFDLGSKAGATNHPKRYVAAPLEIFTAAYQLVSPEHRHAYEIIEGPCHAFFDLEHASENICCPPIYSTRSRGNAAGTQSVWCGGSVADIARRGLWWVCCQMS